MRTAPARSAAERLSELVAPTRGVQLEEELRFDCLGGRRVEFFHRLTGDAELQSLLNPLIGSTVEFTIDPNGHVLTFDAASFEGPNNELPAISGERTRVAVKIATGPRQLVHVLGTYPPPAAVPFDLWVGETFTDGVLANAMFGTEQASVRLAVSASPTFSSPVFSSMVETEDRCAHMSVTGLSSGTDYYCRVEVDSILQAGVTGKFRTLPSSGSLRFIVGGDTRLTSSHNVWDRIRTMSPDFFMMHGDIHYEDSNTTDIATRIALWKSVYDGSEGRARLMRECSFLYMWDDHDFCGNDSYASYAGRDVAVTGFRRRVPVSYVLSGDTDPVYWFKKIGRCVLIATDLRSDRSDNSATDNGSKSMMGVAQKAWFKGILADASNDDCLFIWLNTIPWNATTGADRWSSFSTERTELANHIKAHCPGRVLVVCADRHGFAIDDGTNSDFATGGGGAVKLMIAAPLDQSLHSAVGSYSHGWHNSHNGQIGVVDVFDEGGDEIDVTLTGYRTTSVGVAQLSQYSFQVNVGG